MADLYYRVDDPSVVVDANGIKDFSKKKNPSRAHVYDAMDPAELARMGVSQGKWAVAKTPQPPSVADNFKNSWIDPAINAAGGAWNAAVDFAKGGSASFLFKPAKTISEILGYDPKDLKVHGSGTFTSQYPFISEPRTLEDLATVPDSISGKAGQITGEVAQLVAPGLRTAELPVTAAKAVIKAGGKKAAAKGVAIASRAALEGGQAGLQSYLQTGDPNTAVNAATTSGLLSAPAAAVSNKIGNWAASKGKSWYQEALRIPKATTMERGEDLTSRALDKGLTVNKRGLFDARKSFRDIVSGMKEASNQAYKRGVVFTGESPSQEMGNFIEKIALPSDKEKATRIAGELLQEHFPDNAPIDPNAVERIKEKFNDTLERFYSKGNNAGIVDSSIVDGLLNSFLKGIKNDQEKLITETVKVGNKALPYRQAAKIASKDADLMNLIDDTLRAERSHRGDLSSMIEGAAYGSLAKGSLGTPSQIGVLEKFGRTPDRLSRVGPKLMRAAKDIKTKLPATTVPPAGSVAARLATTRNDNQQPDVMKSVNDWSTNPYR